MKIGAFFLFFAVFFMLYDVIFYFFSYKKNFSEALGLPSFFFKTKNFKWFF